jgi:heat shock protein HslJ
MKNYAVMAVALCLVLAGCKAARSSINTSNTDIHGIKWRLVQIERSEVPNSDNYAYIIIDTAKNTVGGFTGCNSFAGQSTLQPGNKVSFGKMVSTRKFCFEVNYEKQLLDILDVVDGYVIKQDTLTLNKGSVETLAVFVKSIED